MGAAAVVRRAVLLVVLAAPLAAAAASQAGPEKPTAVTLVGGVRVQPRQSQARKPGQCVTRIQWPSLQGLASREVESTLNSALEARWRAADPFAKVECGKEWDAASKAEVSYEIVSLKGAYLTLSRGVSQFTGGAHGLYGSQCTTFSLETGAFVPLARALSVAGRTTLARIAERKLLEEAGAKSLHEAGFLVDSIAIGPDSDLCPTTSGLEVRFAPYEIGPYSMGIVKATLAYAEVRPLFRRLPAAAALLRD